MRVGMFFRIAFNFFVNTALFLLQVAFARAFCSSPGAFLDIALVDRHLPPRRRLRATVSLDYGRILCARISTTFFPLTSSSALFTALHLAVLALPLAVFARRRVQRESDIRTFRRICLSLLLLLSLLAIGIYDIRKLLPLLKILVQSPVHRSRFVDPIFTQRLPSLDLFQSDLINLVLITVVREQSAFTSCTRFCVAACPSRRRIFQAPSSYGRTGPVYA